MGVVWYFNLSGLYFISGFMNLLDTIRIMKVKNYEGKLQIFMQ